MELNVVLIVGLLFILSFSNSQKLCKFTDSPSINVPTFIQHFSSSKCIKVTSFGIFSSSKIVLDDCMFWKDSSKDQMYFLANSTYGKATIKTDAGSGERFCLTTKRDNLYNDICQPTLFDQSWSLKPVRNQKNQFLIEQYSSKKCLIPKSKNKGSEIILAPCNSFVTEQIWKVCL